jgi:hypothetical protein
MNKDEQIRKYLDGELTGEELRNFETEINNSPELKNLVDSYRDTLIQFKKIENVNVEESYLVNIIPRFRERSESKKQSRLKPVFAYGSISIVIVSVLLIFLFNKDYNVTNGNITINEISREELNSYLNANPQDNNELQLTKNIPEEYDSVFNSMVLTELNVDNNAKKYLVDISDNEFNNILDEISNDDAENIYSSLISKKIY